MSAVPLGRPPGHAAGERALGRRLASTLPPGGPRPRSRAPGLAPSRVSMIAIATSLKSDGLLRRVSALARRLSGSNRCAADCRGAPRRHGAGYGRSRPARAQALPRREPVDHAIAEQRHHEQSCSSNPPGGRPGSMRDRAARCQPRSGGRLSRPPGRFSVDLGASIRAVRLAESPIVTAVIPRQRPAQSRREPGDRPGQTDTDVFRSSAAGWALLMADAPC